MIIAIDRDRWDARAWGDAAVYEGDVPGAARQHAMLGCSDVGEDAAPGHAIREVDVVLVTPDGVVWRAAVSVALARTVAGGRHHFATVLWCAPSIERFDDADREALERATGQQIRVGGRAVWPPPTVHHEVPAPERREDAVRIVAADAPGADGCSRRYLIEGPGGAWSVPLTFALEGELGLHDEDLVAVLRDRDECRRAHEAITAGRDVA